MKKVGNLNLSSIITEEELSLLYNNLNFALKIYNHNAIVIGSISETKKTLLKIVENIKSKGIKDSFEFQKEILLFKLHTSINYLLNEPFILEINSKQVSFLIEGIINNIYEKKGPKSNTEDAHGVISTLEQLKNIGISKQEVEFFIKEIQTKHTLKSNIEKIIPGTDFSEVNK